MNINVSMPTRHQVAVIATHLVVGAGAAIAALSFFGGLDASQVKEATQDVDHIAADLQDLYGSMASLVTLAAIAFSAIRSGPFASFFRAAADITGNQKMIEQVKQASFDQKANVVAITDQLPEVAGVATTNTRSGQALATAVPSNTVQVAKLTASVLFAALLLSVFLANDSAMAAPRSVARAAAAPGCALIFDPLKLCGVLTGNLEVDVQRVVKRIAAVNKADLNYAMAKAMAAGTPASKVRLQCIQAISDASDQFNGVRLKNADGTDMVRPDPALVTGIEDVAELVDNLSPQGVLLTSCAGAAKLLGMNALAAVNGIVTGAVSFAALPAGL